MASKDKPEKKPTAQITTRDFEREYLYSELKLNKRTLSDKYMPNKTEQDAVNRKNPGEN